MPMIDSQRKGKEGEREIVHILRRFFPDSDVKRTSQNNGREIPDLLEDRHKTILSEFHLEVTTAERLDVSKKWLRAALDNRAIGRHRTPVVVHKKKRQEWLITLALEDFLALLLRLEQKEKT